MNWNNLKLSRTYNSEVDFAELKGFLKSRIGRNFKLGVLEKEYLVLYYVKSWETELGLDQVPLTKIIVRKEQAVGGREKIVFRLANFVLAFMTLGPIVIFLLAYRGGFVIPIWYLIVSYAGTYLVALMTIHDQSGKLEKDMAGLINS
jgi:hypothetical protein